MLLIENQRITFQFQLSRDYDLLVEYLSIYRVYNCLRTRNWTLIICSTYKGLHNLFRVVISNIIIDVNNEYFCHWSNLSKNNYSGFIEL